MGRASDVNKPTTIYDIARVAGVSIRPCREFSAGSRG